MGYHYDPILCMNVPDSTSKAKDASWKAWTLYVDGKWVKSFSSSMAPIKEAQKFMKENYPGKVGKLVRNTGSSSGYSVSGSEYKDAAPADVRDAKPLSKMDMNELRALYVSLGGDIKRTYGTSRQAMILKIDDLKRKGKDSNKYEEAAAKMLKEGKSGTEIIFALQRMGLTPVDAAHYYGAVKGSAHDSLDKAIRTADKFTVWESDEYDDIYVSYEGGTYVLYVENRPQADGSQQKMIQLGKQEERMRG